jgi:signal peptidase I
MSLAKIFSRIPARARRAAILATFLFGSIASYYFINTCLFGFVEVTGSSMLPALRQGETYLLHRWRVFSEEPARLSIVAIRDPLDDALSVKRIIGLPGERIILQNKRLYVNGNLFEESYLPEDVETEAMYEFARDFTLSSDQYFLLGDNRDNSVDSRIYGAVESERLLGMIYP